MTNLSPLQESAIDLLAIGTRKNATAEKIGVSTSTIFAWLKTPEFRRALDQRLDEVRQEAMDMMKQLSRQAVAKMDEILDSDFETVPPNVQLSCAVKIIELSAPKGNDIKASNASPESDPAIDFFRRFTGGDFKRNDNDAVNSAVFLPNID